MAEKEKLTRTDISRALQDDNPQRNSGIVIPLRMESDTLPQSQPDNTYRFALNAIIEDRMDTGMIRTEESNEVAFNLDKVYNPKNEGIYVNVYLKCMVVGKGYGDAVFLNGAKYSNEDDFENDVPAIRSYLETISCSDYFVTDFRINGSQMMNLSEAKSSIESYKNYSIYAYATALNEIVINTEIVPVEQNESLNWTKITPNVGDEFSISTIGNILDENEFLKNGYQINTDPTKPYAQVHTDSGSILLYDDDTYIITGLETEINIYVEPIWDKCDLYAVPSTFTDCDTIGIISSDERIPVYSYVPVGSKSLIYIALDTSEPQLWMKQVIVSCDGQQLDKTDDMAELANMDNGFYYGDGIYIIVKSDITDNKVITVSNSYYDYCKDLVFENARQLPNPIITTYSGTRQFKCTITGGSSNGVTFRYRFDDTGEWQIIGYNTLIYYPANVSKVSVYAVKEGWNNSNTVEENL